LQTVFIGLEFGLWKKQGGIAALNAQTGEKKWSRTIETLVHSSPAVSRKHRVVVVGSSNGLVSAFNSKDGTPAWTFQTNGAVRAGFAINDDLGVTCFGSNDRYIYIVKTKTGELVHKIETLEPIYSTPIISGNSLFFGLLDKRTLCIDIPTGTIQWTQWAHSRVFATPIIVENSLFIGSNDGRLYEYDPATGAERGYIQLSERIVNKAAYNIRTRRLFVPTYANEIYCFVTKEEHKVPRFGPTR
jgi:outer membrane protein assembly factor BamB